MPFRFNLSMRLMSDTIKSTIRCLHNKIMKYMDLVDDQIHTAS